MNLDTLLQRLPSLAVADRAKLRANCERWRASGTAEQKTAAEAVIEALAAQEQADAANLYERLKDRPLSRRVVDAFRVATMSENERKTIQALLDNPGTSSTELSRACGHDSMIWQMHFGNLCKEREARLWPAPKAETREGHFYSGILADIDPETNRFTMRPEAVAAFAELGLKARAR